MKDSIQENKILEGDKMAVSKDSEKGTWTSQIWVEDWQGKKKHKKKRGFVTKKEALEWEHSMQHTSKTDVNMKLLIDLDLAGLKKLENYWLKSHTARCVHKNVEHIFAGGWGIPNKQNERTLVRECVSEYPKRIS